MKQHVPNTQHTNNTTTHKTKLGISWQENDFKTKNMFNHDCDIVLYLIKKILTENNNYWKKLKYDLK